MSYNSYQWYNVVRSNPENKYKCHSYTDRVGYTWNRKEAGRISLRSSLARKNIVHDRRNRELHNLGDIMLQDKKKPISLNKFFEMK